MTRLVQIQNGATRRVALVDEPTCDCSAGVESIYELAQESPWRVESLCSN